MNKFNELKKSLKGVKFTSNQDWELFLPYNTKREKIQVIIDKCREMETLDWHIVYTKANEKNPEPPIRMWWDKISNCKECDVIKEK